MTPTLKVRDGEAIAEASVLVSMYRLATGRLQAIVYLGAPTDKRNTYRVLYGVCLVLYEWEVVQPVPPSSQPRALSS